MADENVSETRKERLIKKLRASTGITADQLNDEQILSCTADSTFRANIELRMAAEDLSKAVKLHLKDTKDDFIKAFSKLKNKF